MYSELFDQLGANGRLHSHRESAANNNANEDAAGKFLVQCKAGKMELKAVETPEAGEPQQFQCAPLKTRGEIRLLWKDNALQWQWYDRREKLVKEEFKITANSATSSTFERVVLPDKKKHQQDRIYVWNRGSTSAGSNDDPKYIMYWMQDVSDEKEDELVVKINQYLADPASAAPADSSDAMDTTETGSASGTAGANASDSTNHQVDALSSILENLGMPAAGSSAASSSSEQQQPGTSTTTTAAPTATLTLADLQGAMAGIQQQQLLRQQGAVSLSEIVTPEAITGILQDDAACQRLLELLPEEQRNRQYLEENLRSPQVQQTLRALTATLLPDEEDTNNLSHDLSGLYSVLANFQLDPAAGQEAIAAGNPIQAFLDCIIKKVAEEKMEEDDSGNNNDEEGKEQE